MIQEAISKGDFNNLSGYGKPLSQSQTQNPYVDFTQHKINKILLDNGFSPEWITLQKDIREQVHELRTALQNQRLYFGSLPLTADEEIEWQNLVRKYKPDINNINAKIDKYNFLVPILNNQMLHVKLKNVADKVLNGLAVNENHQKMVGTRKQTARRIVKGEAEQKGLLSFLVSLF